MSEDKVKVLVVDDIEANLFAMQQVLKPIDGIEIITASNGRDALDILNEQEIALVFLDVQMPEMNGYEVASKIQELENYNCDVPIILVTAINTEEEFISNGYQSGAIDYISKPVNNDILIKKTKAFVKLFENKKKLEQANKQLQILSNKNESILTFAGEGILVISKDGAIMLSNPASQKLLEVEESEIIGMSICDIITTDETKKYGWNDSVLYKCANNNNTYHIDNTEFRKINGQRFPVDYTFSPIKDDPDTAGMIIFRDISIRKHAEEQLIKLARYDSLTGLANRSVFKDSLVRSMARAARQKQMVGVMFLDLDHFKEVNDKHGHTIGDQLLISVANRLQKCIRTNDMAARLGGDEFAIILDLISSSDNAAHIAQKIIDTVGGQHELDGISVYISPSIGITIYPGESETPEDILKSADSAMYRAKEVGRNNYQFYDRKMYEKARERAHLENELKIATMRNDFELYYQPQISSKTGQICGLEALLRWPHYDFGMVSPAVFIPAAESTGLITTIGEWVLRTVCQQTHEWVEKGITGLDLTVALNVSTRQLRDGTFAKMVEEVIKTSHLEPNQVEIEITESTIMDDPETAIAELQKVHDLGVKIAMDDFGTGFSSLSYLNMLPIDTIKIDQSFTKDIGEDPKDEAIVKAIIGLAHTLGLKVIAEGVEEEYHVNFLRENGCDILQGYFYSRPVAVDIITELLTENDSDHNNTVPKS
ncbi:MAG: GGDEF domain-containing response regulator [Gammaproteobacteria bacterium]|nr:MAG: GGDEF domain-containing response regulator [Gammaproteobacteria bacterium]